MWVERKNESDIRYWHYIVFGLELENLSKKCLGRR